MVYFSAQYHNLVCTHSVILVIEAIWLVRYYGLFNNIRLLANGQCVSSVFFLFFRKWSFKNRQYPRVDVFRQEKTSTDSKRRFSIFYGLVLCPMDCLQLPFIRVEEAVSWTQRFLTRKIWPKNEVYLWQTNLKANVCRNSTFQVNRKKNATGRRRLTSSNRYASLSALYAKNTPNLFGYKIGDSTENNKALLLFSGKETIQSFNGSI